MIQDSLEFDFHPDTVIAITGYDTTGGKLTYNFDTTYYDSTYFGGTLSSFFPINGRGLSSDSDTTNNGYGLNNGSFTMALHNRIKYRGNEMLSFTTDDDGVLYLNNRVAIDLFYMHSTMGRKVPVDSLAVTCGMTKGQIYDIDVFFAERFPNNSSMQIITDLQFQDVQPGTRDVAVREPRLSRPFARNDLQTGISVPVFPGRSMVVPAQTATVAMACYSSAGRLLASSRSVAVAGLSRALLRRPAAGELVFVKAECRDKNGTPLKTVFGRFVTTGR
jgi:fibro-slime domain-containing protein